MTAHTQARPVASAPEHVALAAILDRDPDDARDALAGLLPDDLSALALACRELADICDCTARGRR